MAEAPRPVNDGAMLRRLATILAVGAALALAVELPEPDRASAQEGSEDPVLHEYFDPGMVDRPDPRPGPDGERPTADAEGPGGPPELTLQAGAGDRVRGPSGPVGEGDAQHPYGPAAPRDAATALDDQTDRVDDLEYNSVFDPTVFPYKRGVVQNRPVLTGSGTYGMKTERGDYEQLRVQGDGAAEDEDVFWGSFLVRAQSGAFHPIPSVAPDQRYLEVDTEPEVSVRIFRDEAGNDYVQLDHSGRVRVNVRVAAPNFYFSGRFGSEVAWEDFDSKQEATRLPEEIASVAADAAELVEVSRRSSPDAVLEQMIYYFRNFETKSLPEDLRTGDLYRTLVESQIGVCRHRSMAFVITSMSLGIPARYVTNEAHAFVEVWWPEGGWRRVDLGGAARDIGYNGEADDRMHAASRDDPFPKPPAYREELRELRGEGGGGEDGESSNGAADEGESGPQKSSDGDRQSASPPSRETSSDRPSERRSARNPDAGSAPVSGSEAPEGESAEGRASPSRSAPVERSEGAREPTASEESPSRSEDRSERRGARLSIRVPSREVFRGADVVVEGRLVAEGGAPIAGREVVVHFGRVGVSRLDATERLAAVQTDENGRYRLEVTIPESVGVGRWSLLASFPGDETFESARAE